MASMVWCCVAYADEQWDAERNSVTVCDDGSILAMKDKTDGSDIVFRRDCWKGPAFEGVSLEKTAPGRYEGVKDGIKYSLQYQSTGEAVEVVAGLENMSGKMWMPERARLLLGIDTCMVRFPDWDTVYFPTLQRSERTHFWSYYMTPCGKIVACVSPDPVASWANIYQQSPGKFGSEMGYWGQHRIFTTAADLLHRLPLPARHPQHLDKLMPGQKLETRFRFVSVSGLEKVKSTAARYTGASMIDAEFYTVGEGVPFFGTLCALEEPRVEVRTPRNEIIRVSLSPMSSEDGVHRFSWIWFPGSGSGLYTMMAYGAGGKVSEAMFYVRPGWDFYLQGARKEALRSLPTATHHAECFYPFYTYFLAKRYIPDQELDDRTETVFQEIFPELYNADKGTMRNGIYRIQDSATMVGILADRYHVSRDMRDMERALKLADSLISCQREDGAYYNPEHNVHYTSVIYIAKSLMELMDEIAPLAAGDQHWKHAYARLLQSVRRAVDNLALKEDDIQTEGQMTFEDGMISCSVNQLALAALKEREPERRAYLTEKAVKLAAKHRCLTQSLIPDCRMNGATLRFWEYQYTINLMTNGMNSPCGWSAWKIYGDWYLYLLTGKYDYLRRAFNALGTCVQLLDRDTGELRFGFVSDPYLDACQYLESPVGSGKPMPKRVVVGEQYLSQTSSWLKAPHVAWRKKWGIDNFVHEVFKCMSEIALTSAYIVEHENGLLSSLNCSIDKSGHVLTVTTREKLVNKLHINLKQPATIVTEFGGVRKTYENVSGLQWLGEQPEETLPFIDDILPVGEK